MKKSLKIIIKIIFTVILLIPFIFICTFILPFFIAPVLNDVTLNNFSNHLYNYKLPKDTRILEKHSICGKLNGNGNGMDFLASMLITSNLSPDELKNYYIKAGLKPAKNNKDLYGKTEIEIIQPTSSKLESQYLEHGEINFKKLDNIKDLSNHYIIVIYNGGYSADFDIRGH